MPFEPVTLRPAAHPSLPSPIKVIGVGGGGSNAVNTMFERGIAGVDFIVCNTDAQALDASPVPSKIQLGATLTGGQGAGSQPEVGRNAAIESLDEVIGPAVFSLGREGSFATVLMTVTFLGQAEPGHALLGEATVVHAGARHVLPRLLRRVPERREHGGRRRR
jgi:hypothetical protein